MNTDPIADFLTRIRNANNARKASVDVPWSRQKEALARVLVDEGYLESVNVVDGKPRNILRLELRYDGQRRPIISGVRRVSRPSLRAGLRSLAAKGVLVTRHGTGTFVADGPPTLDSEPLNRTGHVRFDQIALVHQRELSCERPASP